MQKLQWVPVYTQNRPKCLPFSQKRNSINRLRRTRLQKVKISSYFQCKTDPVYTFLNAILVFPRISFRDIYLYSEIFYILPSKSSPSYHVVQLLLGKAEMNILLIPFFNISLEHLYNFDHSSNDLEAEYTTFPFVSLICP